MHRPPSRCGVLWRLEKTHAGTQTCTVSPAKAQALDFQMDASRHGSQSSQPGLPPRPAVHRPAPPPSEGITLPMHAAPAEATGLKVWRPGLGFNELALRPGPQLPEPLRRACRLAAAASSQRVRCAIKVGPWLNAHGLHRCHSIGGRAIRAMRGAQEAGDAGSSRCGPKARGVFGGR